MLRTILHTIVWVLLAASLLPLNAATRQQVQEMIRQHDYEHALPALRSLMQQPAMQRDADMCKWYGQTLCMTGSYAESLPYLEKGAKGGKTGAWWYMGISLQHLWDFDGAIEALETYRDKCSTTSGWIERTDSIIAECRLGQRAVQHVQDVVIIDSLQVPMQDFWSCYLPGAESGRLLPANVLGMERSGSVVSNMVFENQPGDCRLWVAQDSVTGANMLWQSHAFQGQWEEPQPVPSVASTQYNVGYPWQRTDGETLFFACDSTPGLGGLDIYMTTYDTDLEAYRSPQRLGMPFNSPYNDYMMAIDESHQVGWWATDRNADPGMVQIYLFLYEEEPFYLEEAQPERARISSIAETWREEGGYAALVNEIREGPQQHVPTSRLWIPIDDQTVYTQPEDFHDETARSLFFKALSLKEERSSTLNRLEQLRIEYHASDASQRAQLAPLILSLERRSEELRRQMEGTEKEYKIKEKGNLRREKGNLRRVKGKGKSEK